MTAASGGRDFWTPERKAELRKLWDDGLSTREIGRRMGITKNAAIGKAHRLGLKARPNRVRKRGAPMRPKAGKPEPMAMLAGPQCAWPIGAPGDKHFHFCETRAIDGKPYCAEHEARAHQHSPLKRISAP